MKKILLLFLAAVLTGCGIYLAFYIYGGYREDKEIKDSMKSVELLQSQAVVSKEDAGGGQVPDEPDGNTSSINPGISVDFGVLSDTNPDIMAWLHIPDTYISFPVLQERTLMEYYYLDHDHTGQHNTAGAIFTPAEPPGTDDITIVNRPDGLKLPDTGSREAMVLMYIASILLSCSMLAFYIAGRKRGTRHEDK